MSLYVNTTGKFTFKDPVNSAIDEDIEYNIVAVRSIKELIDTGDEPFATIYEPIGIGKDLYRKDVEDNINIVVLTNTNGGSYTYVPESFIVVSPDSSGYKHAEILLAINLGKIPLDIDLTSLKEEVQDLIQSLIGLKTEAKELVTSSIELMNEVDHTTYLRKLNYGGSKEESYRIKYEKLLEAYNKKFDFNQKINDGLVVKMETEEIPVTVEVNE